MHIAPHDNQNKPIVDVDDSTVPLNYFNIVKLKAGQSFDYQVPGYETCIVPATGTVDVEVEGVIFTALGNRGQDVWDGEPEGVYAPVGAKVTIRCTSDTETFIAGARYDKVLDPFDVRVVEIDRPDGALIVAIQPAASEDRDRREHATAAERAKRGALGAGTGVFAIFHPVESAFAEIRELP